MQTLSRAQIISERLTALVYAVAAGTFAYVGGTMTELWIVFIPLAIVLFAFVITRPELALGDDDGMAGLYGGVLLFVVIGGLAYAGWQDDHPIRAAQTYAITGTICLFMAAQSISGYFHRRAKRQYSINRARATLRP